MTSLHSGRAASLAATLLAGVLTLPVTAAAQSTGGVLTPAGQLRVEFSSAFHLWDQRFGLREQDGHRLEEAEPLGFDLEHQPLVPLDPLAQGLQAALDDAAPELVLGSVRALVARERTRLSFAAALGVFDWLTLAASVPVVKARTEVAFDFRAPPGSNLGVNPSLAGDGRVQFYLDALDASLAALEARRAEACPGGGGCAELTDLVGRYASFTTGLGAAYRATPLFVTAGSAVGNALLKRLDGFRTAAALHAPEVTLPGPPPLADGPVDQEILRALLAHPAAGLLLINPLSTDGGLWELGDVELSLAIRLLEGAVRDASAAPPRFRYLVGARALVRLPTGATDDPDVPLDIGGGGGQLDLELGGFVDVGGRRLGLSAEAQWGIQRPVDLVRRIAPPELVLAPQATRLPVRWTPGSYLQVELAPRWSFNDLLAVGGLYRYFAKGEDRYELRAGALPVPPPFGAKVLERETEATSHEVGFALTISTLGHWREGRTSIPLEVHVAVRQAVAGSGGAVPKGVRLEASARVLWRLWRPQPVGAP